MKNPLTISISTSAIAQSIDSELNIKIKADKNGVQQSVAFSYNGSKFQSFRIEYIPVISHKIAPLVINQIKQKGADDTIVFSKVIYSNIGKMLEEAGINFLDEAGNVFLRGNDFFIHRTGRTVTKPKTVNKSRLFQDAGIKLIFGILNHPDFIKLSYREMAVATNISLGSISVLMNELISADFLENRSNGVKKITRYSDLLNRWVAAYQEVLKPQIIVGRYTFWDKDLVRNFKKIPLENWSGLWGGEAGGEILTEHLVPEKLTQFVSEENPQPWKKSMKLIPAETDWDIEIAHIFWSVDHPLFKESSPFPNIVPILLVYADLASSSDIRNRETAKMIYEQYLRNR